MQIIEAISTPVQISKRGKLEGNSFDAISYRRLALWPAPPLTLCACNYLDLPVNLQPMKPTLLLPIFALLASSVASAQPHRDAPNWVRIQTENDGNTSTFVDVKSIRAGNGYRLAWVKEVFKTNPNSIKEIRVQYEVDCKDPSVSVLRSRVYLKDGSIKDTFKEESRSYIFPDDTGGLKTLHVTVCGARVRA